MRPFFLAPLLAILLSSAAPAQPAGGLTYYATRAAFDAAHPGLPVEDFEDVTIDGFWCASFSPVDWNTDDACYDPGTLPVGLGLAAYGPTQNEWDALIAHAAGSFGQPSIVVGANLEVDTTAVWFGGTKPTIAAGMDVFAFFANPGNPGITVEVYDDGGALLGTTTVEADTLGTFFGVRAHGAALGTIRLDMDEDYVMVDNVAFAMILGGSAETLPEAASSFSVSPNPLVETGTVALTLVRPSSVVLAVFDVLGRRVATLHDGALGAGPHTFSFDGRGLPPGAYVVRLTADGASAARRVTVAR